MDPCPVLVGRQQELATLRGILDAGGGVAIVSGEAGIGKSRLVREFAKEAEKQGRSPIWARPDEVASSGPYAMVLDLLAGIESQIGPDAKREVLALSNELLRTTTSGGLRGPTPQQVAARLRGLTAALRSPLVIVEDLHLGDESSHGVILHLARSARDDGHLLVCSYRSEELETSPSLSRLLDALERGRIAIQMRLFPLSDDQVAVMLEALLGRDISGPELSRIYRLGEGIPFFVEELADGSDAAIPRSIELTVSARMLRLEKDAQRTTRYASLVAGAIDPNVLSLASDVPVSDVTSHLGSAAKAGLLADRDGRLVFRHGLVRDAVSNGVLSIESAVMHGRLGRAIEDMHSGELDLHSSALAHHFSESGDKERATNYLLMAGERALAFAATEEARVAFNDALGLNSGVCVPATRGLAEVEFREGNEARAAELFRDAADELVRMDKPVEAALTLGRLAWAIRNHADSAQVIATLDEALKTLGDAERHHEFVELLVQKGQMLSFMLDRYGAAAVILEEAVQLAQKRQDFGLLAQAFDGLAQVADSDGVRDEALRFGEEATHAALKSDISEVIGRVHHNHAVKLASFGDPTEGLRVLAAGRQRLEDEYGRAGVSAIDVTHAWICWLMGLPNEVANLVARGHAVWQRWRGYRRTMEIWVALEQGQVALAESRTSSAWSEVGGLSVREDAIGSVRGSDIESRQLLFCEGLLRLHVGPVEEALRVAEAVVALDQAGSSELFDMGQGLALLSLCAVKAGALSRANEAADDLERLLQRVFRYPYLDAWLQEIRASLLLLDDRVDQAASLFLSASELFANCANASDRARCLRLAAEARLNTGDPDVRETALRELRTALALADQSGAVAERNRIEGTLRAAGVRARAGRPRKSAESSKSLSPREAEVAVLVATGATNAEIARELFLSDRTVQDHITNALRKLSLNGRASLAAWAARQGLV